VRGWSAFDEAKATGLPLLLRLLAEELTELLVGQRLRVATALVSDLLLEEPSGLQPCVRSLDVLAVLTVHRRLVESGEDLLIALSRTDDAADPRLVSFTNSGFSRQSRNVRMLTPSSSANAVIVLG
jgi:hypothetical protein